MMDKKRLTKEAIFRLSHQKNHWIKLKICETLGWCHNTILNKIRRNDWNGDLTKDAVLDVLEENLPMSRADLLETKEEEE
jgi:hypothetical protein